MKRIAILATLVIVVALLAASASAQTSSGTLTVTATVNGSINLVFNTATSPAGITLTGTGTNAATMAFGNVSAYGTLGSNIGRSVGASSFTVSSPFGVEVSKVNSSSANYTLTAQLSTADATNTWQVGGSTISSASATTLTATGAYSSTAPGTQYTLALTIPFTTTSGTVISNGVNFTATAN